MEITKVKLETVYYITIDEGYTFARCDGVWYEVNAVLGDRADEVTNDTLKLELEAAFWKAMYMTKKEVS